MKAQPHDTTWQLIRKEAIKSLVPSTITLIGLAIVSYFSLLSLDTRVTALEETSVRKDVLSETLEPMKSDIKDIKGDIKTLLVRTNE